MNREELIALADKILRKEASEAEIQQYNAWYNAMQQGEDFEIADAEQKGADIYARVAQATTNNTKVRRLWPGLGVRSAVGIAAAVAAITLGTWLYVNEIASSRRASRNDDLVTNDIAPGRNTATVTLADGKIITLSDAKTGVIINKSGLKYNDQSEIASSRSASRNDGAENTLVVATPRGGTYQVTLPDGTHVWLNADTKISFPSQFIGRERKVLLTSGEAYFEVSKDKTHPFIVESNNQQVTVLGTHFNINTYADEGSTKTTLLEGSVSVSSLREGTTKQSHLDSKNEIASSRSASHNDGQGGGTILKPGQQSVLTDNNRIAVTNVDITDAVAWKNGDFIFNKESLAGIMNSIARWYDIEVSYDPGVDVKQTFSVLVSRNKNISQILLSLENTGKVKFKIEGKKVSVSQ